MSEAKLDQVVVVISREPGLRQAIADLPLSIVENPLPERGVSSSIAIGLRSLKEAQAAALIGVADQPQLTAAALAQLIAAFQPGRIVVARYQDHRGNPAIFDRRYFAELQALSGDVGGQRVIAAHPEVVTEVSLPAEMGRDVDRPEDWEG